MSREELTAELQKCIDANECDHGMLYWQCSRGTGLRAHNFPPKDVKPNLMIFTVPCDLVPMDQTFELISMEDTRFLHCNIKTLNLIPSVIAYQRCIEAGCQETVFHRGERVTECAHSNVLMLKDGVLCTPPRDNLILPGTTLKHLLELAEKEGIPTREEPFTMEELRNADEIIVSSSGGLCIQATTLDGQPVGGKDPKHLKQLQEAYLQFYAEDTK
jgi:D-alanine transaminase